MGRHFLTPKKSSAIQTNMAMYCRLNSYKSLRIGNLFFSTSCCVNSRWRKQQGLEPNPRQYSPLTLLPDYSFVDGRTVPLSKNKLKKIQYQQNLCKKIVDLNNEIDVGLELHHKRIQEEKIKKEEIIKNKLKEKGAALLKTTKKITNR